MELLSLKGRWANSLSSEFHFDSHVWAAAEAASQLTCSNPPLVPITWLQPLVGDTIIQQTDSDDGLSSVNGNLDLLDEDLLDDDFGECDDSSVYSSEEETLGATTTDQPNDKMQTKNVEVIWKCLVSLRSFASSIYLISICRTQLFWIKPSHFLQTFGSRP